MFNKMMMAVACLSAATCSDRHGDGESEAPLRDTGRQRYAPRGLYSIRQISSRWSSSLPTPQRREHFRLGNAHRGAESGNQAAHQRRPEARRKGYELDKIWLEGQDLGFELSE